MIAAISGDITGSVDEAWPVKREDFPLLYLRGRFANDSVWTVAVAQAVLEGRPYGDTIRELGRRYPHAGYGGAFFQWLSAPNPPPYHSWRNGAAMRVSPVGWAFATREGVPREAAASAEICVWERQQ